MTHEANVSDKQIEDEWQAYCDELAKDTDGVEDGKGPDVQEEENAPHQAWNEWCVGMMAGLMNNVIAIFLGYFVCVMNGTKDGCIKGNAAM